MGDQPEALYFCDPDKKAPCGIGRGIKGSSELQVFSAGSLHSLQSDAIIKAGRRALKVI